ncbi:hypothetical protein AB0J63_26520 [Streptosporangium canum]|uniref:hypothetical protein n=1 Tax=Streptosporangium canum TaxID=324952 RepID=UPI003442F1B4
MPIAIHGSSPAGANSFAPVVSPSFSPPAGSLLVALVGGTGTPTISNSGTARTWTQRVVHGTYGGIRIYTAPNPTALSTITVTVAGASGGAKVFVVTGQHSTNPIGTTGTGATATNNATVNAYTSTATGSRGFLVAVDWNGVYLSAPSSTDDEYAWALGDATAGIAATKAANTGASGTVVQFNLDASGTAAADWNWVALEIVPASLDATITATVVDAVANIPTPSITAISNAAVSPATVDASADIPTPGISAGARVSPATVDAQAVIPTPSVTAGSAQLVEPVTVTATAVIPTPSITAIQNATASPATVDATADIPAPTITATRQSVISPVTVDARADISTPGVSVPVLPGEGIARDGQVEWGGVVWGDGTSYRVREITGWESSPQLDDLSVEDPARHGAIAGQSLAQRRIVTVRLQVDSIADPTQVSALLRQLRYDTRILRDNTLWPLVIRGYTETLLAYAKVGDRTGVMDADWSIGAPEPVITFICPDPRRYSLEQQSTVIAAGGTETLVNDGDVYTSPIYRFTGPATNPAVLNETLDRVLAFDITLTSGQRLDVDTQRGTVRIGSTNHMADLADNISVPVKEFFLDAGSSVLTYETDSGGTAGVECIWRSATM